MKETTWSWDQTCEDAFVKLKESLGEYSLLHHYVIGRETELVVDASITGFGAVLLQRASKTGPFHPVMYKSRSLNKLKPNTPQRSERLWRFDGHAKSSGSTSSVHRNSVSSPTINH